MTTPLSVSPRNSLVDVSKGMGIVLIVFGHNWIVGHDRGELFRLIFSFHVPLFFFLAGIFLRSSDRLLPFIASRAGSLLKPYFVVLLTLGVFELCAAAWSGTVDQDQLDYFAGVLYAASGTVDWTPMWFLPHLFLASVAGLAVLRWARGRTHARAWLVLLAGVFLVAGIFTVGIYRQQVEAYAPPIHDGNLPGLPWSLDLVPITLAFMVMGYVLSKPVQAMRFRWLRFGLALAVFAGLHLGFDESMDLNRRVYGNPVISTLQAVAGIYLTLGLAAFVQRFSRLSRALTYLCSGSLFILIFHGAVQGRVFGALGRLSSNLQVNGLLSLAAGIVLPLLLWELAHRQKLASSLLLPQRVSSARVPLLTP